MAWLLAAAVCVCVKHAPRRLAVLVVPVPSARSRPPALADSARFPAADLAPRLGFGLRRILSTLTQCSTILGRRSRCLFRQAAPVLLLLEAG